MQQGLARQRARELGGIAVGARWKGDHWLLGGWPNAKNETWIVVSLDKTTVLYDGYCLGESNLQEAVEEQKATARLPLNVLDFQKAVNDRVDWIRANCPEVLERPVMLLTGEDGLCRIINDVFVEEGLVIRSKPPYRPETRGE